MLNIERSHRQKVDSHINLQCCGLITGISEHLNTCKRCITTLINERAQRVPSTDAAQRSSFIRKEKETFCNRFIHQRRRPEGERCWSLEDERDEDERTRSNRKGNEAENKQMEENKK